MTEIGGGQETRTTAPARDVAPFGAIGAERNGHGHRPTDLSNLSHRPTSDGSFSQKVKFGLARVVRGLGGFALARWLTRRGFFIMCWHSVSTEDEHERFPDLYLSQESLRRRIQHLKRHYQIVSLDEAMRQHAAGKIEPNRVVLTFDDGLYNFYHAAFPILKELDVPATVYVVSQPMDEGAPAWSLLLRDMILRSPLMRLPAGALTEVPEGAPLEKFSQRKSLSGRLLKRLENHPQGPEELCRRAALALEVDLDELLRRRLWSYVTPAEARELADAGISVQLHTHTHEMFEGNVKSYAEEIRTCRGLVEAATGHPAPDFCYPGGYWTEAAWPALQQNNIRSAVTTHMGPNFAGTPPYALRRVADGNSVPEILFELHVSGLRWIIMALLHPRLWFKPSEKQKPFAETGVGF